MKTNSKDTTGTSNISILTKGLLALNLKREIEEGAYTAVNLITKNRGVIQRRHQYSAEIERVIKEITLTTQLLEAISEEKEDHTGYSPEEMINYYNGVFLGQVHQLKDKLLRLIDRMLVVPEDVGDSRKKDPREVKLTSFIDRNREELQKIGIVDLLEAWGHGQISVALSRRTQHHHFISTLPLNDAFQKITMSRIALNPVSIGVVSDYGKKRLQEIGTESLTTLKAETARKQKETLQTVKENIDRVAGKLIAYYGIPKSNSDIAEIINEYMGFLSYDEIKNESSLKNIDPEIRKIIDEFVGFNSSFFGEKLVSVYLVGSVGRGRYLPGSSDINLIIVLQGLPLNSATQDVARPFEVTFIDEGSLQSDAYAKERFIIWSDGVLLYGKGVTIDTSSFPKPGTLLTLLLNRNYFDELEAIKQRIQNIDKPTKEVLRFLTLKLVKLVMNFDFGLAMANKPYYSSDRDKKVAHIKTVFPEESRVDLFDKIYRSGFLSTEDLLMVIDTVKPNAEKNFHKMIDVEKKINED